MVLDVPKIDEDRQRSFKNGVTGQQNTKETSVS
jgi:hypothetical protein